MRMTVAFGLLAVLVAGPVAFASVALDQVYSLSPDSVTVGQWTWSASSLRLGVPETMSAPGSIQGIFDAGGAGNYQAWIHKDVTNETTFAWTDYHIEVTMADQFSILGAAAPASWTTAITQPALQSDSSWLGTIDYDIGSGTAVPIGGVGQFGVQISFAGPWLQFTMNQTPTPEPVSLALLAVGSLSLGWFRRRGD